MLFHVSIDAHDPRRVATALAGLMGGIATPFPPVAEGSWVAMAGDDRNTLVEVYPRGTRLVEGEGEDELVAVAGEGGPTATHFALATALARQDVFRIALREGWPAKICRRGDMFDVIELWLEGECLVEVLTPEMQAEYLSSMTLAKWQSLMAVFSQRQSVAA
ncbi:hypothetical protein [Novosphingobium album (ex Liu et al. 2023)]|uniref:Uncharacterized protein n=1 Tax=Novosphingobium album (ex Liu et al. 2023) TaxID=3031130 RepID=A0ABT5WTT7_9SPHN|nr:hypothetical protein [Novosphingobium album (ex Liu et al. 2023)]MDE8653311.1 hypothetical protein [Novosphingobium album (ex Liu et al. 2023)]